MAQGPWTPGPRWPQAVRRPVVGGRGVRARGRATALGLCTPGTRCPQAAGGGGCPGRCGRGVPAGSHGTVQGPWTPGTRCPQAVGCPGRCARGVPAGSHGTVQGPWTPGTRCPPSAVRRPQAAPADVNTVSAPGVVRPSGERGHLVRGVRRPWAARLWVDAVSACGVIRPSRRCGHLVPGRRRVLPPSGAWRRGASGCAAVGPRCPRPGVCGPGSGSAVSTSGGVGSWVGVRGVHVVRGVCGPGRGYALSTLSRECGVPGRGTRCPRCLGSVWSRVGVRGVHVVWGVCRPGRGYAVCTRDREGAGAGWSGAVGAGGPGGGARCRVGLERQGSVPDRHREVAPDRR